MGGSSSRVGTSVTPKDGRTTPPGTAAGDLAGAHSAVSASSSTTSDVPHSMASTRAGEAPESAASPSPVDSATPSSSGATTSQDVAIQRVSVAGSGSAATAVDPTSDHAAPTAISRLWTTGTDPEQLGVAWTAATDDRGSVWYEVSVNGFTVTTTQQTDASVGWFNDSSTHVIQVRAADTAGNKGPWSPTVLVTRPSPSTPLERAERAAPNDGSAPVATPTHSASPTDGGSPSDSGTPKEDNS